MKHLSATKILRVLLYLWEKGLYRPPRLYSLAQILIDLGDKYPVLSYPTGGNKVTCAY